MSDASELLLQLKDIHEPIAPATSSALLMTLFVLVGLLLLFGAVALHFWHRNALNRSLQQELAHISQTNDDRSLQQLAVMLRRLMHHIHGDSINHLQNDQWLDSLDKTFNTSYFSEGPGSIFGEALYQPHNTRPDTTQPDILSGSQTNIPSKKYPDTRRLCTDLHRLIGQVRLRPQKQVRLRT